MRQFHVLVHSLLLITSPSLLAYPQYEQPTIQQVYNQERLFDGFNLTYDDILDLLQDIEEGRIEELSGEKIDRISRFIAFLAQQGMLSGDYAANSALENDIAALFENQENFYDYAYASDSFDEYNLLPTILNGKEDAMVFLCKHKHKHKHHHHHHKDKHKHHVFAQVKDFVQKHKKAIIIGAAILTAAIVVIVAVAAVSSAAAVTAAGAAAGAAAAPESTRKSDTKDEQENFSSTAGPANNPPGMITPLEDSALKSAIEHQIVSFKENIIQNEFFQPTNPSIGQEGLSWEESGRTLGSLFAHDSYKNIQHQLSYHPELSQEIQDINSKYPISEWNQGAVIGRSEIDRKFSTDYSYLYSNPNQEVDFNTLSYQVRGERALSSGYYNQAIQDLGKAIETNPTNPIPYLERGIAHFSLGQYDRSLEDYQQFTSQVQKANSLSVSEFSLGFAKGLPKGVYESGEGLVRLISDLVTHPVRTGEQMWDALNLLSNLARSEEWSCISQILAPEVHQLVKEWDILPSDKKGELAGYAFGKYGADIVIPGALAKTVSKGVKGAQELSIAYQGLKNAEKTLILESVSSLENGAKIAEVIQSKTAVIAEKLGFNTREIGQLENLGKIEESISNIAKNIPNAAQDINFTNHALQRAIERGVSRESILDALASPLKVEEVKIDKFGRPSLRLIGQKAEVVINPETQQIVSVNPTSTKKFEKFNNELNNVKDRTE